MRVRRCDGKGKSMDEFWKRVEPLIPVRQRKQACPGAHRAQGGDAGAARTGRRRATLALGLCFLPALGAPARSQQRGAGRDVHENGVGHVKADYAKPNSATVGVEFCGTGISSRNGGGTTKAD